MKILIKLFFILSFSTIITENINGETITYEGMKFNLKNGVAELVKASEAYIPPSTIMIPDTIFYNSEAFPVTEIGDESMQNMNLNKLNVPNTIKKIGKNAFKNTTVRNLYIKSLATWCNIDFDYWVIGGNTFYNLYSYASPIGPETVLYINNQPVEEILTIPEGTGIINRFAFNNLKVNKVVIEDNVTLIGANAFENSTLQELNLGSCLESIGTKAFVNCSNLQKIYLSPTLSLIEYKVFEGCDVKEVYCPSLESWLNVRYYWGQLDGVSFEPKFGSRSYDLYIDGNLAENIVTPEDTKIIEAMAFAGSNIKSAIINEGVTEILFNAFANCSFLETLVLPSTLEVFQGFLDYCTALRSITVKSVVPPVPTYPFQSIVRTNKNPILENCILYVPQESVEIYRNNDDWGVFKNILPIDESGVESITDENLQDKVIYDLQGRRVSGENLAPGIYVIDGKKIKI